MDKIRLDFFDILGYLIPGTALLLSLWITADTSVLSLSDLYTFIGKIETKTLLSGVIVAYIMGFTLHFFGSMIFKRLNIPPRKITSENMPEYWALLREYGEKHLIILDRWQALKALASNLAAFSCIALVLCLIKGYFTGHWEWFALMPIFLGLSLIYAERAVVFHIYYDEDSFAVFEALNLKEKLPAHLR
jgi:hypothetical protein